MATTSWTSPPRKTLDNAEVGDSIGLRSDRRSITNLLLSWWVQSITISWRSRLKCLSSHGNLRCANCRHNVYWQLVSACSVVCYQLLHYITFSQYKSTFISANQLGITFATISVHQAWLLSSFHRCNWATAFLLITSWEWSNSVWTTPSQTTLQLEFKK